MLAKADVYEKFKELHNQYTHRYIDDYETFVRSRVIEYYINTTEEPIDNIIETAMCLLSGQEPPLFRETPINGLVDNDDKAYNQSNHTTATPLVKSKGNMVIPYLLIGVAATVGIIAYIFKNNK